jgi:hypothetical protein
MPGSAERAAGREGVSFLNTRNVPEELMVKAKAAAADEELTLRDWLIKLVRFHVKHEGRDPGFIETEGPVQGQFLIWDFPADLKKELKIISIRADMDMREIVIGLMQQATGKRKKKKSA